MRLIRFLLVLAGAPLFAATFTAASCNFADVNGLINNTGGTQQHLAVNGDVINVPAGTCTWTSGITVPRGIGISIIGAGSASTHIIDSVAGPLFLAHPTNTSSLMRISGMAFSQGTSSGSPFEVFATWNTGSCPEFRFDNNTVATWSGLPAFTLINLNDMCGVVDHNTITGDGSATGGTAVINPNHASFGTSGAWGDASWAASPSYGSRTNIFVEDNTFNAGAFAMDCDHNSENLQETGGCRVVVRYNNFTAVPQAAAPAQNHGTESGGRFRGGYSMEVYGNTMTETTTSAGFVGIRSGGALIWGNTFNMGGFGASNLANLSLYRYDNTQASDTHFSPWFTCDGTSAWDHNDGVVYDHGTYSGGVFTSQGLGSWTAHQWQGPAGSPYSVRNTTQGWGTEISDNTTTGLTVNGFPFINWGNQNAGTVNWANGDSWQILRATECIDAPGHGGLTGTTTTLSSANPPTPTGWVNEVLNPVREWMDSKTGASNFNLGVITGIAGTSNGSLHLIRNRDAYEENQAQAAQTSPTSPFDGSTTIGMGHGTLANRPTTCTTGVGYWATDSGPAWKNGTVGGQLFTCGPTNTWTVAYTPFTYPHPLVSGGSQTLPALSATPASLTYNNIGVGTTSSPQTVTVQNTGSAVATLSSISFSGTNQTEFAISSQTCVLGPLTPGASCTISVTATPAAPGTRTANLNIVDTPDSITASVTLTATGTTSTGRTFYVATTGSNANSCANAQITAGSPPVPTSPKLYVSQGVACASTPGDSVQIQDGTYGIEGQPTGNTGSGATVVTVSNVGTSANHITIRAQDPGQVILDGGATQGPTSTTCNGVDQYFTINGAAFVDWIGLTVQNTCFQGITGASANTGHDLTFTQMDIHNVARYSGNLPFGQDGMFFNPNMFNILVDRSVFHDIGRLGGPINPALDHGVYSEANNTTVRNSIFYNYQWGWPVQVKAPATGALIAGNTFYQGNPTFGGAISFDDFSGTIGTVQITDNIFLNPPLSKVVHSGNANVTCTYDHNITDVATFSDTGGCTAGAGNLMSTTASLVSPSTFDFHYNAASPGIGAGTAVSGLTQDYAGVIRPTPPSMGALEFTSGGGGPIITLTPSALTFTSQSVGTTSATQFVTASNTGTGTLSLTNSARSGDFGSPGTGTCTNSTGLPNGQSCTYSVNFTPTAPGTRTGTLTVTSNAVSGTNTASLTGTGVVPTPVLTFSSGTSACGSSNIKVQVTCPALTLQNTGNAPATISSVGLSGLTSSSFGQTNTCGTLPATLAVGASCTITPTMTPLSSGSLSAVITVTDIPDNNQTATATASGTGIDTTAITVITSASCLTGPWPGTCTIPATGVGNLLLVWYSSYNNAGTTDTMTSITDNAAGGSDTFAQVPGCRSLSTLSGSGYWNDCWIASNIKAGVTSLTITPSAGESANVRVFEISNVASVDTAAVLNSQAATATPTTAAVTTTGSKEIVLTLMHPQPQANPTGLVAGSPWTGSCIDTMCYAYNILSSAGTYSTQWSQTSGTYASSTVALMPATPTVNTPGGVSVSGSLLNGVVVH